MAASPVFDARLQPQPSAWPTYPVHQTTPCASFIAPHHHVMPQCFCVATSYLHAMWAMYQRCLLALSFTPPCPVHTDRPPPGACCACPPALRLHTLSTHSRSEEHTSELQSHVKL